MTRLWNAKGHKCIRYHTNKRLPCESCPVPSPYARAQYFLHLHSFRSKNTGVTKFELALRYCQVPGAADMLALDARCWHLTQWRWRLSLPAIMRAMPARSSSWCSLSSLLRLSSRARLRSRASNGDRCPEPPSSEPWWYGHIMSEWVFDKDGLGIRIAARLLRFRTSGGGGGSKVAALVSTTHKIVTVEDFRSAANIYPVLQMLRTFFTQFLRLFYNLCCMKILILNKTKERAMKYTTSNTCSCKTYNTETVSNWHIFWS